LHLAAPTPRGPRDRATDRPRYDASAARNCACIRPGRRLYEDEQQNARETRSRAQIMRDALAKVNWQEIAEALRQE
jgi:hypothetical protein